MHNADPTAIDCHCPYCAAWLVEKGAWRSGGQFIQNSQVTDGQARV